MSFLSSKTVIRTRDFNASKSFYMEVLQMELYESYDDGDGSKGVILRIGDENSTALLEISEIMDYNEYHQDAFDKKLDSDKMGLQIRTDDVQYWADRLKEKRWSARGPVLRPWGSYYLYLRDPDGLQIIIYQEKGDL
ncbi:VOC family protein [Aureisphaera galaxeae]|uniref:VOC family protein n=1 Tax=Aureisphaera galaxeae TaxID=1538023 RepID=UPI00234FF517|nr:VOC family protein [Aureisphaera galaxeae]MDC8004869.1 VOC family protein [Aureisphaera galaxeae]